ncbi:hypothetical protein SANTM175S_05066 [Streptomyces antimycoticus]
MLKDYADRELMRRSGLVAFELDQGRGGPRGNFRFERGFLVCRWPSPDQCVRPPYGNASPGELDARRIRPAANCCREQFGDRLVTAFGEVKDLFDPDNRMNPGKVVAPHPVDEDLRLGPHWRPRTHQPNFGYPDDQGTFTHAAMRCVGIGNWRTHTGAAMCPSYRATGEEEHSTRGRGRLLSATLVGHRRLGDLRRPGFHRGP